MRVIWWSVICTAVLCATTAEAQDDQAPATRAGLPLPYAQRPLTLPQYTLRGDAALFVEHFPDFVDARGELRSPPLTVIGSLGAGFALHDDFEVGAVVLPILFSPDVRYANPSVYGTFRFLRGTVEMGATFRAMFPVRRNTDALLDPGVLMLFHIGERARLDVSALFRITLADPDPFLSLVVPIAFSFNATDSLYFGVESGSTVERFETELWAIPLSFFAGYAIPGSGGGPLVDVEARVGWPELFTPGLDDTTHGGHWQLLLVHRVYIGLR